MHEIAHSISDIAISLLFRLLYERATRELLPKFVQCVVTDEYAQYATTTPSRNQNEACKEGV